MALIDNEKLYENIEKKLELIKAAKEQPVIMKPFIKDFTYPVCRKTPCFSYGDIRYFHRIYASN